MDLKKTLDDLMRKSRRASDANPSGGASPPPPPVAAGFSSSPPPPAGYEPQFYAGGGGVQPVAMTSSPPMPPPQYTPAAASYMASNQNVKPVASSSPNNYNNSNNGNGNQYGIHDDTDAPVLTQPTIPGHNSTKELAIRTIPKLLTGNLIIVGDIHGCPQQFNDLLRKVNFRQGVDCLILAGDLVNKGPDSIGVVKRAMQLNAFAVLGNHDYTLLKLCDEFRAGRLTAEDAEGDPVAECAINFPDDCYKYLRGLPHILKVPQYQLMVIHAGLDVQKVKLKDQKLWDLMHIRRILRDGTCIEKGDDGSLWARLWDGPETIVFGHDARTGFQEEEYAIGLDTGCCYGGTLSAVVYPGKKFHSVPGLPASERPRAEKRRKPTDSPSTLENGREAATPASMRLASVASDAFPATPAAPSNGLVLANGKILTPSGLVQQPSGSSFPAAPSPAPKAPQGSNSPSIHSDPAVHSASIKGISIPAPRSKKSDPPTPSSAVQPAPNNNNNGGEVNVLTLLRDAQAAASGQASGVSSPQKTSSPIPTPTTKPPIAPPKPCAASPSPSAAAASPASKAAPSAANMDLLRHTREDAIAAVTLVKSAPALVALFESLSFEEHWEDIVEDAKMEKKIWVDAVLVLIRSCLDSDAAQCLGYVQDIVHGREDVRAAVQDKALAAVDVLEKGGKIKERVLRQTRIALRPHQ